jgi:thiol-disulfide isomerase/thioredoxin
MLNIFIKLFLIFISLFVSSFSFALKSDGKVHLIHDELKKQFSFTLEKGFHFNIQAPCFLTNGKDKITPNLKIEQSLIFSEPQSISDGAKISFYVCDDAKTVCEPQTFNINKNSKNNDANKRKANSTQNKIPQQLIYDSEGFILDNFEASIEIAKQQKKVLLLDFSANWCPACLRLSHESFKTSEFVNTSKKFILAKIDVDLEQNQNLLKKYNIKAFPSLVFINSDGNEVARILDYVPGNLLANKLIEINKNSAFSITELEKKSETGDKESQKKLTSYYYNSLNFEKAAKLFEKYNLKTLEYFSSLVNLTDENPNQYPKLETLKSAVANYPEHYYSMDWRKQLAEELKKQGKENWKEPLMEAKNLAMQWIDNPKLSQAALAKGELIELNDLLIPETHSLLSDICELLDDKDCFQKQSEFAIQKTLDLKPSVENPTLIIYLVHYMKRIRSTKEIIPWLTQLETAYPKEFTYFYRHASLLQEKNESSSALPQAVKALELSYGANKFKSGLLLAKIQTSLKNKPGAIKTLQGLLNSKLAKQEIYKHLIASIKKFYDEINK